MRDIVAKLQSGCVAGNISHQIVVLGRDHPQWTKGLAFLLTFLLGYEGFQIGCVTGYQVIRVIRIFAKTYPFGSLEIFLHPYMVILVYKV